MPGLVGVPPPLVQLLVGALLPTVEPLSSAPVLRALSLLVVVLPLAAPPVGPLDRLRLDSWALFRPLLMTRLVSTPLPLVQLLVGALLRSALPVLMAPLLLVMSFLAFLGRCGASCYAPHGAPPSVAPRLRSAPPSLVRRPVGASLPSALSLLAAPLSPMLGLVTAPQPCMRPLAGASLSPLSFRVVVLPSTLPLARLRSRLCLDSWALPRPLCGCSRALRCLPLCRS